MSTEETKTLPLLSLRNLVLFPGAVMPVEIGRPSSLRLIEALGGKGARVLVGTQKDADIEEPSSSDLYTICVEGEVVRIVKAAENRVTAVLRGLAEREVQSVLVEGGAAVHGAFITAGLVDQVALFLAPRLLGAGVPIAAGKGRGLVRGLALSQINARAVGGDILLTAQASPKT